MSKNNLISIIIPAYNKSEELRTCLASVFQQNYPAFEVIAVNDGSTDNTVHILEEYKHKFWQKNIRFKIIQQNNQGAQMARNRGLREARGAFLIFWDADVVASPQMMTKMHAALQNHSDASYAYASFTYGKKKFKLWDFDKEKLKQMPCIHTTTLIKYDDFPGKWNTSVDRLQDWDMFLTMLEKDKIGVFVPEFLFTVLTDHGTMSSWLPKVAYKFMPWHENVKKYQNAVAVIKKKHGL